MKTTLLILFATCFGLLAQNADTPTDGASDADMRDAILRRVVRSQTATKPAAPAVPAPGPAQAAPAQAQPATPAAADANSAQAAPTPPLVPGAFGAPAAVPAPAPVAPTASAAPAPAIAEQPVVEEEATNEMIFPAIDINTFLDTYSKLVDRTLLKAPNIGNPTISLETQEKLTRTQMIQAMDTVLAMNGIVTINVDSNFVKVVPQATAGPQAGKFYTGDTSNLGNLDQFTSAIIQLKYVKPSDIVPVITPFSQNPSQIFPLDSSSVLVVRDYSSNIKRIMEVISRVDILAPSEFESEVIPIKYAKAADIASALVSLGGTVSAGIPGSSVGSTGGARGTGAPSLGGAPGGYTTGTSAPGAAGPLGTQPTAAGTAPRTQSFGDRLRGVLGSAGGGNGEIKVFGQNKIIPDERSNSLLVFANAQDMAAIKKVITNLDVCLAQVLIEAIIMEVSVNKSLNLGVSYLQTTPSTPGHYLSGIGAVNNGTFLNQGNFVPSGSNGFGSLPSGLSYAMTFGDDFQATITAIAEDSKIKVLSRPRIQTEHGVPASLKVGNTVPYVTGTYFGGVNGQASSQYTQTFVGIDLEVTPWVNSDGLVVMQIIQDVEQLGPTTTIDGNPVPTTTQRTASSSVSVRDHDTIILGGLISSQKSASKSGVPLLKDIPVLGALFRTSNDTGEEVELIILIRPTVLMTPRDASLLAEHERERMPDIKAAEAEYRRSENARLKKANKITVPDELP